MDSREAVTHRRSLLGARSSYLAKRLVRPDPLRFAL